MPQSNVVTNRKNNFLVLTLWDTLRFSPFVYEKKITMSAKCQGYESVCPFSEHFTYSTEAWVPILTDNLWEHMLI